MNAIPPVAPMYSRRWRWARQIALVAGGLLVVMIAVFALHAVRVAQEVAAVQRRIVVPLPTYMASNNAVSTVVLPFDRAVVVEETVVAATPTPLSAPPTRIPTAPAATVSAATAAVATVVPDAPNVPPAPAPTIPVTFETPTAAPILTLPSLPTATAPPPLLPPTAMPPIPIPSMRPPTAIPPTVLPTAVPPIPPTIAPPARPTFPPAPSAIRAATIAATSAAPNAAQVLRDGAGIIAGGTTTGGEPVWGGKRLVHILLLGIDRRDDETGPSRSDVMMIATVDVSSGTASLLSIPRDLVVTIPGWGQDRVNAAFAYGQVAHPNDPAAGPALAVETVSKQFGVPIEHYILLDFHGFTGVVNAVGGVDLLVSRAINDPQYPTDDYGYMRVHFDPGMQHMDGTRALIYARTRHDSSDDERRDRQMQVMQAVLERSLEFDGARRLPEIIRALGNSVQTSIPWEGQLSLARMSRRVQENIVARYSIRAPLVRNATTSAGASVYVGDWQRIRQLVLEATDPKRQDAQR